MKVEIKNSWSEIYSDREMAKEIGYNVISKISMDGYVITHDGLYHSDDVFSTALLRYVCGNENFEVVRSRSSKEDYFTYDVGNGDFDHHSSDEYRYEEEDGIFASFGKLWCTVGRTIIGLREEIWKEIDNSFVQFIDCTDNTGVMNPINYYMNSLRVNGVDGKGFEAAVNVAYEILEKIIQSGLSKSKELDDLEKEVVAYSNTDSNVLELSRYYNVGKSSYAKLGYDWIVFPDKDSECYMIQSVSKKLLPNNKRGLVNEGDIVFTHKGGWLGKARNKEAVLSLLT